MSRPTRRGKSERAWQYHSRSDLHSKVACWTLLLDMLEGCDQFRDDASRGLVAVAVNHVLVGPINKTLDLVVCRPRDSRQVTKGRNFASLADEYEIQLDEEDRISLQRLPVVPLEGRDDVSEVVIALEAKACMTAHSKSLPRLHAEILATGFLAKQAAPNCITVSHTLVNAASTFLSPGMRELNNLHLQPDDAQSVVEMVRRAIPRVTEGFRFGYDLVGVSVIECRNDGTPVVLVDGPPAPARDDFLRYDRMMVALCGQYRRLIRPS